MTTKSDLESCEGCREALNAYMYFNKHHMRHKIICDTCGMVWGAKKVEI